MNAMFCRHFNPMEQLLLLYTTRHRNNIAKQKSIENQY